MYLDRPPPGAPLRPLAAPPCCRSPNGCGTT